MARTVAGLPDRFYFGVFNAFRKDPRFTDLLLRIGKGVSGLVHARPKLPRYDIGLFSAFEQTWTLQGYSRGALVKFFSLERLMPILFVVGYIIVLAYQVPPDMAAGIVHDAIARVDALVSAFTRR
jgi:hypothetical protein